MGQYQQWLHYREVEQLLQAQLESLVKDLAQLQEQAQRLQQGVQLLDHAPEPGPTNGNVHLLTDNPILQVLAASMRAHSVPGPGSSRASRIPSPPPARPEKPVRGADVEKMNGISAAQANSTSETMSSALFGWSNLPNFGPQAVPEEEAITNRRAAQQQKQPLPQIPHTDIVLLPEDMVTFLDQHALTDPRIELPRWLRPITDAASANHPDTPVDQETIRTNRLVQRWIERWGRQSLPNSSPEGESQS
jgi:hypothetical protein